MLLLFSWSECRDSNPRPLGPEPSAIPNFATPRCQAIIIKFAGLVNSYTPFLGALRWVKVSMNLGVVPQQPPSKVAPLF